MNAEVISNFTYVWLYVVNLSMRVANGYSLTQVPQKLEKFCSVKETGQADDHQKSSFVREPRLPTMCTPLALTWSKGMHATGYRRCINKARI